jgi:hypothetical protein
MVRQTRSLMLEPAGRPVGVRGQRPDTSTTLGLWKECENPIALFHTGITMCVPACSLTNRN